MDAKRVGIYGTSAGGQNSLGALLFHPEFYKAGYSACGCHDNRMDKIWWNEQWMGWPIGPHYGASSNVDNSTRPRGPAAHRCVLPRATRRSRSRAMPSAACASRSALACS